MSNSAAGPTGPNVKPPMGPTGATGASCSPQGATIGTIPVNPSPSFPTNWVTVNIPSGWWGYASTIPKPEEPAAKKKDNRDGCDCKKCKEFYPYAEPNQEDGTLICYRCRMGW